PAGGVTGLDTGAPGARGTLVALGDRRREVQQLVPGLGDLVAGLLEHRGRVPDERLHVGAQRRGVERAVDRAVLLPLGRPALVNVGLDLLGGREHRVVVAHERLEQTRLRQDRDVRRVARLDARRDLRLHLARGLVVDRDARALLERLVRRRLRLGLGLDDRRVDGDRLALEVAELVVGGTVDLVRGGLPAAAAVATAVVGVGTGRQDQGEARAGRRDSGSPAS